MSDVDAPTAPETEPKTRAGRRVRTPGAPVAAEAQPAAAVSKDDGLPNAIDIDARKIKSPVLTRQGWVVPDEAYQRQAAKG